MECEIWKDICGFGNKYQVSSCGRVRNKTTGRLLKHGLRKNRYIYVTLYERWNGYKRSIPVHRLVAFAFVKNPCPDKYNEVNHKDENPSNNHVSNLEWCDRYYNVHYGTAIARKAKKLSISKKGTRLSEATKRKIASNPNIVGNTNRRKKLYMLNDKGIVLAVFDHSYDAEAATGVNRSNISACCNGRLKHAGPYIWKYEL